MDFLTTAPTWLMISAFIIMLIIDISASFEPAKLVGKMLTQSASMDYIIENGRDNIKADMMTFMTAHDSGMGLSLEIPWYTSVVWNSGKDKEFRKLSNSWNGQLLDNHYKMLLIRLEKEKQIILSTKEMEDCMMKRFFEANNIATSFVSEVKMITRKKSLLPIKFLGRKEPVLYHFVLANFISDVSMFTNINEEMRVTSNKLNQLF